MNDMRYTYAVARINALSTRLLGREFSSRMLDAGVEECVRMLAETVYAESMGSLESPEQLDQGLSRELRKTYDLLEKICPDEELIRLFRLRYDFHNLKVMLQSQVSGVPDTETLMDIGTCDLGELSSAVREREFRYLPEHIKETALDALSEYERVRRLVAISYVCDRSMWTWMLRKANKGRNTIVTNLIRQCVNVENVKTFIRVKEFAEDREIFDRFFIPGGAYSIEFFRQHMDEQLGLFFSHLETECERHIVSEGLDLWPEDKSFWPIETAFDNCILAQFWEMRMQLFSIAPLLLYLLRKEAEVKLIRTIIRSKLVGMPRLRIEARLRYLYV